MGIESIFISIFTILNVILTIVSWNVNELNSEGVVYGIRVPIRFRGHLGIKKITSNFRRNVFVFNFINIILFLVTFNLWARVTTLITFIVFNIIILMVCYIISNREMLKLKDKVKWFEMGSRSVEFEESVEGNNQAKPYYFYIISIAIAIGFFLLLMLLVEGNVFNSVKYSDVIVKYLGTATLSISAYPILIMVFGNKIKMKKLKANVIKEERYIDDDNYYIGGLLYCNEKDKNIMVVRRMGMGYDLNYGTTIGKVIGVGNILLIVGITILSLFMEI